MVTFDMIQEARDLVDSLRAAYDRKLDRVRRGVESIGEMERYYDALLKAETRRARRVVKQIYQNVSYGG